MISNLIKTMKKFSNAIGYHQPDLSTKLSDFLLLWWKANARNVGFFTLYGG